MFLIIFFVRTFNLKKIKLNFYIFKMSQNYSIKIMAFFILFWDIILNYFLIDLMREV